MSRPQRAASASVAPLAVASVLLAGCALDAGVRNAVYRDTPAAPHPVGAGYKDASFFLASRIIPRRGNGANVGGEVEAALGAGATEGSPRFELRNVALVVGYSWLPPPDGTRSQGVELIGLIGLGQPAGELHPDECRPAPCDGTRYHLGAGVNLVHPLVPFDATRGFIIAGAMLDIVADVRAGIWSPPTGDNSDHPLFEATLGLSVRGRVISDLLSSYGYPVRTRTR